ncbi:DUF7504 family protein [Halobacterium litoreum]|uniref:Uncharacterized protein n=1 Tax=Halobacterium litoreum TaxID=2039234 RepID=A0ABD5NES3_9EURY|nr:hypothetical protein [Halobacterium litoreum]UHH13360.1 hypothetical protein LT972_14530 [Halobacterium litoreum]
MTRASQSRSRDTAADDAVPVVDDARAACTDLLAHGDHALVVALDATPREWLADRGHAAPNPAFVATYPHPDCVRVVSDLREPVAVALAAEEFLASLPDGAAPAVCVDGLDRLAERAGPLRTARFLSVLANRVRAAGGTCHYHGGADCSHVPASDP